MIDKKQSFGAAVPLKEQIEDWKMTYHDPYDGAPVVDDAYKQDFIAKYANRHNDRGVRYFYKEYDEIDEEWCVFGADEGYEQGAFYDVLMFCTSSEQDAIDAIELLIELQEGKE